MSKSSSKRFYKFFAFFPYFCFLVNAFSIDHYATSFMSLLVVSLCSSRPRIDAPTQTSMLAGPLPPTSLDIYRLRYLLRYKSSCIIISFLVLLSIFLPSSISRMIPSILQGETGDYPFNEIPAIEFDFETFSLSTKILFLKFFFHFHLLHGVRF